MNVDQNWVNGRLFVCNNTLILRSFENTKIWIWIMSLSTLAHTGFPSMVLSIYALHNSQSVRKSSGSSILPVSHLWGEDTVCN